MSPSRTRHFSRSNTAALATVLEAIARVPGVTDYMFLDAQGTPVTWTSNYGYDAERLSECAEILRRSRGLLDQYLGAELAASEPLACHFRSSWLLVWQLEASAIMVLGREGLELPTLRMQLNVLRNTLATDKRFRRALGDRASIGPDWLRQTAASETERGWIDRLCGTPRPPSGTHAP